MVIFSQGSILVDYFVELANLQQKVNTQELKVIFHDSLRTYNTNRWNETSTKGPLRMGTFTIDPKYTDFVGTSNIFRFPRYLFIMHVLSFFSHTQSEHAAVYRER